jgi:hypothetical protein
MCQLAATNRCSNPHLTIEQNCVMDDRWAQQAAAAPTTVQCVAALHGITPSRHAAVERSKQWQHANSRYSGELNTRPSHVLAGVHSNTSCTPLLAAPYAGNIRCCASLHCRLDSPIWMVSHHVNASGAFADAKRGVLDVTPLNPLDTPNFNRHEHAKEPQLSMWLMYACPHLLNGLRYTCQSRMLDVRSSGTTFMANERTLSALGSVSFEDLAKRSPEGINRAQVRFCLQEAA